MATEVELNVTANTAEAQKSIKKFGDDTSKSLLNVESSFAALAVPMAAIAVAAIAAGAAIVALAVKAVPAAIESEDAILKLNLALAASGEYSKKASDSFQKLASSIQKQTGVSDEAVLKNISLAKSYGLTNDQTTKLIKAAVELSAVTGDDLNSSTEKLGKTFNGFNDKTLSKMIPGFKQLTEEQLRNGAAVDLVAKKYTGFAAQLSNTFSGSIRIAKSGFDEFLESFGRVITENPVIIVLIKKVGEAFLSMAEYVDKNKVAMSNLISDSIKGLLTIAPPVIDVLKIFSQVVVGISSDVAFMTRDIILATGAIYRFSAAVTFGDLSKKYEKLADDLAEVAYKAGTMGVAAEKSFGDLNTGADKAKGLVAKLHGELDKLPATIKRVADSVKNSPIEIKLLNKDQIKEQIEQGLKAPIVAGIVVSISKIEFPESSKIPRLIGQIIGGVDSMLKGAQGAIDLLASGIGAVADAFLPGAGAAVTAIVKVLAQGPEAVRKLVTEFIRAIPVIIENIILSIPEVLEALADGLPDIIDRLVDRAPDIIEKLVEKAPILIEKLAVELPAKLVAKLIAAVPQIAGALIGRLIQGIPEFLGQAGQFLINALAKIPETIINGVAEGIKGVFNGLTGNIFGGGGGGLFGGIGNVVGGIVGGIGNAVSSIGHAFGFAEGGQVPLGFPQDNFPAKLTSGEIVIPRGDVDRLSAFLDRQQGIRDATPSKEAFGERNLTINLSVGEDQLAKVLLNLNKRGFRTA